MDNVLNGFSETFRRYDFGKYDWKRFCRELDLSEFDGTEVSTALVYGYRRPLMARYDIRDEYELHNLLRRVWRGSDIDLRFRKILILVIGDGSRER